MCPAASHLHSEQWSQSSALYNSTARFILRQCNSMDPWGRRSHRQESLLPSASPSPLDQKSEFLFLTPLRGVAGRLPVSSHLQFSIPPKNQNAQYSSGQPKGGTGKPLPGCRDVHTSTSSSFPPGSRAGKKMCSCVPADSSFPSTLKGHKQLSRQ